MAPIGMNADNVLHGFCQIQKRNILYYVFKEGINDLYTDKTLNTFQNSLILIKYTEKSL